MQYALLVAAQNDDPYDRQLGPIHLVKYVYLSDMEYAKYHEGQTYTGTDWKFHHFGPWSTAVFNQIDSALVPLGAKKKSFPSKFSDEDCIRWTIGFDQTAHDKVKKELPMDVWGSVAKYVEKYRDDTSALLHYVYATAPMLNAAPEESLDFSTVVLHKQEKKEPYVPFLERLSKRKRKALKEGMEELRERFMKKVDETPEYPQPPSGRIDAVYEEGVAWLCHLAGEPFPEQGATIHFSDEIWKSEARRGDDCNFGFSYR